jgi:hypothetical protein
MHPSRRKMPPEILAGFCAPKPDHPPRSESGGNLVGIWTARSGSGALCSSLLSTWAGKSLSQRFFPSQLYKSFAPTEFCSFAVFFEAKKGTPYQKRNSLTKKGNPKQKKRKFQTKKGNPKQTKKDK